MLTCLFSTEISVAEHERKDFNLLPLHFMSCKKKLLLRPVIIVYLVQKKTVQ